MSDVSFRSLVWNNYFCWIRNVTVPQSLVCVWSVLCVNTCSFGDLETTLVATSFPRVSLSLLLSLSMNAKSLCSFHLCTARAERRLKPWKQCSSLGSHSKSPPSSRIPSVPLKVWITSFLFLLAPRREALLHQVSEWGWLQIPDPWVDILHSCSGLRSPISKLMWLYSVQSAQLFLVLLPSWPLLTSLPCSNCLKGGPLYPLRASLLPAPNLTWNHWQPSFSTAQLPCASLFNKGTYADHASWNTILNWATILTGLCLHLFVFLWGWYFYLCKIPPIMRSFFWGKLLWPPLPTEERPDTVAWDHVT
jgi:hypothetical protein